LKTGAKIRTFPYQPTPMANPISRTAYYTLAVRAWDANLPNPVCGDSYAKVFMNDEAQKVWQEFRAESRPNASNAARHEIIDRHLQNALTASPDSFVVIIGAGFDTRAFRLKGGRWIEVDESQIISVKESRLPSATCPNPLTRIPIDFSRELLAEKLSSHDTTDTVHVIIEGVLMYLSEEARVSLLKTLKQIFPTHIVYCDLMRRSFFNRYGKSVHEKIISLGATFTEMKEHPEELFINNGYQVLSCTSIPLRAVEHAGQAIPLFVVKYFLKTLRNGYGIWRFKTGAL
jgi:methyltransferase (TIGR00027 family)